MSTFNPSGGFTAFWRIENFSLCQPSMEISLKSEVFRVDIISNSRWYLAIEQEKEQFLAAYICKQSPSKYFNIRVSISLLTIFGWIPIIKNVPFTFKPVDHGYGTHELIEWNKLMQQQHLYLPNDSLTIGFHLYKHSIRSKSGQCSIVSKMISETELVNISLEEFCVQIPNELESFPALCTPQTSQSPVLCTPQAKLVKTKSTQTDKSSENKNSNDLLCFFKEKKFSFVTLRTQNKEFVVHKALLCAKSPVFNAMFERPMTEHESNNVDISDVEDETMSLMLKFLHLEPLNNLEWNMAIKLYYAGDKYQIDSLKKVCASFLVKEISDENVCDVFVLADVHQDSKLMDYGLKYFLRNSKNILRSERWKSLLLIKTELASNILCALTAKMQN